MYLIKQDLITDTREKQRKPQNAQRQEKYRYRLFEDKIVRKYNLEMAKYTECVNFHQDTGKVLSVMCSSIGWLL